MGGFEILIVLGLIRALFIYALVLIPLVLGFALLLHWRQKLIGLILIVASTLPVGYFVNQWHEAKVLPEQRAAEIASWLRATATAEYPRVLVVRDGFDKPRPFTYFLAETGLFDVYAAQGLGLNGAPRTVWRLHVEPNSDCRRLRTERAEMVVLTGWQACATAIPVDAAPEEGLILYTGEFVAPHSLWNTKHDFNNRAAWTLELTLRQTSSEKIIAYDEFIKFREFKFNPLVGPFLRERDPPQRLVTANSSVVAAPEPGAFTLASLKIDEHAIMPPFALGAEDRQREVEQLVATSRADDIHRALDVIASAGPDPVFYSTMVNLAANPVTSVLMRLDQQPRWCEKIKGLMRYRDALIEGCSNSPLPQEKCAQVSYSGEWLGNCADNSVPIWPSPASSPKRVFIANARKGIKSPVELRGLTMLIEVLVPADRGAIDLVVRNQGATVLSLKGAVSCIARLTVLENPLGGAATGVIGIEAARVRFAAPAGAGSWVDPKAPLTYHLGAKPDVTLVDYSGPVDLGPLLERQKGTPPCGSEVAPPVQDTLVSSDNAPIELDPSAVLTAPPLLPRKSK